MSFTKVIKISKYPVWKRFKINIDKEIASICLTSHIISIDGLLSKTPHLLITFN